MSIHQAAESIGNVWGDRYHLVAPIGTGASARVYLADDLRLRRRVAVKVLHEMHSGDAAFLKRFSAEARAAAALNNPNVMHVYDFGQFDGRPYLVLEFVGGGSLRSMLDTSGPLTPSQGLVVALGAAKGLEYAHRQGLIHRDIKPANLLFGEDGRLRIADFGLARALSGADWTEPLGKLLGTAKYTSPEQAQGLELDGRTDVYSLALVIIEACTGRVPFENDSKQAMLAARVEPDVEVPRELGRLAPVLAAAGRADRTQRPDAGELVVALMAAAEDMDPPVPLMLPGAISTEVLDDRVAMAAASQVVLDDDEALSGLTGGVPVGPGRVADGTTEGLAGSAAAGGPDEPSGLPAAGALGLASLGSQDAAPGIDISLDDSASEAGSTGGSSAGDTVSRRRWPRILGAIVALAVVAGAAVWWFGIRVPTIAVPDVVGMSADEGSAELRDLGFLVDVSDRYQDGSTAGEIIAQDPADGAGLADGEVVGLVVSLGNTLVTLPDFTDGDNPVTRETFEGVLKLASLSAGDVTEMNSEDVPEGHVVSVSADVDEDNRLPKDSPVDVVFSLGPTPRVIPAGLVGSSIDAVRKQLLDQQLAVQTNDRYSDQRAGTVLTISEKANAEVERDTVVVVGVSIGPEPIAVPDVTGRTGTEADEILRSAGFTVTAIEGAPSGEVLATDPPAGEKLLPGASVRIVTRL